MLGKKGVREIPRANRQADDHKGEHLEALLDGDSPSANIERRQADASRDRLR